MSVSSSSNIQHVEHSGGPDTFKECKRIDLMLAWLAPKKAQENRVDEFFHDEWFMEKPEWKLACQVAASRGFSRSDLLQRFLLHVCELQLTGREKEINEQKIGIRIFNRPEGYDPGNDNIVRSYARMLRKRLDTYFAHEGHEETRRIVIPRGGYVPVFEQQAADKQKHEVEVREKENGNIERTAGFPTVQPDLESAKQHLTKILSAYGKAGLAGLLAGILLTCVFGWCLFHFGLLRPHHTTSLLWNQIFDKNRETLIVPSDSGLGVLQNLAHQNISVDEYVNGSYLDKIRPAAGIEEGNFNDLSRQRYTSAVDLGLVLDLTKFPEFDGHRTSLRYARNVTPEDLLNANVILIGSKHANPWVALYENKMNFHMEYTPRVDQSYVINGKPLAGEQAVYSNGSGPQGLATWGVVAWETNSGGGHVLILEGLNMAATQAAANLVFNENLMAPILREARRKDGSLRSFEILLETTSIGASAQDMRIVAKRICTE